MNSIINVLRASNSKFIQNSIKNVYIHLECYDYQPLIMNLKNNKNER